MIRQAVTTRVTPLGDDEVELVLSTGYLARDGHILVPQGCDLEAYRKNPVWLWSHDPLVPVGRSTAIRVESDSILCNMQFAPLGISPKADEIRGLVKSGVINAASVGFEPKEGEPLDPKRPNGGQRWTRWELLEASFVAVPADPAALVTARAFQQRSAMEHMQEAKAFIDEATDHHRELKRCYERGEEKEMMRAHGRLGVCLRGALRSFASAAKAAEMADLEANQSLQTSAGLTGGTSASAYTSFPRRQSRLAQLAAAGLPPRPIQPMGDGTGVGVLALRDFEFQRARAQIAGVVEAGQFPLPASRAERRERLRLLTRL